MADHEPVSLFAELCCGSAVTTLAVLDGYDRKPPSSYQGSKLGFREAILDELGLVAGAGAEAVLLCDPGPWSHAWATLSTPAGCLDVSAELRGWADEDPEELFRELRASAPPDGSHVAAWLLLQSWNYARKPAERGTCSFNRGAAYDAHGGSTVERIAARVDELVELPWPSARRFASSSALDVDPAEVSTWLAEERAAPPEAFGAQLDGAVVYIDPPYQGTSGYRHKLPRAEVLALARRWDDAGAVVAVSEAEPLAGELGPGWRSVEITDRRRGPRRTFSRQQREFLTTNRKRAA